MKTLGVKAVGTSVPVDYDTLFQIGSCSKAFNSALIAKLVDQGIIEWDRPVIEYYPEFRLYDPVSTNLVNQRDLLSHRCGLPPHSGDDLYFFNYSFPQILNKIRYIKNDTPFRSTFEYQNTLYSLSGESAARIKGQKWSDLLKREILKPLGMKTATAEYGEFMNSPNHSHTHYNEKGVVYDIKPLSYDVFGPAGGVSASIKELGNWIKFQLNQGYYQGVQLVSQKSLQKTRTAHIQMGDNGWYGLGWGILKDYEGRVYLSHAGSTVYSTSEISLLPSHATGVMVLSNEGFYGAAFNGAVILGFYDILLKGKPQLDYWSVLKKYAEIPAPDPYEHLGKPPQPPQPSLSLKTYTGAYYSPYYGKVQINQQGNILLLYPGKSSTSFNLTHWDGNIFKETSTNTAVNFTHIENGKSKQVMIKMYDIEDKNGTFQRN